MSSRAPGTIADAQARLVAEYARARLRRLRQAASQQGLSEPPPYGNPETVRGWRAGYDDALADMANGKLEHPR